MQLSGPAAQRRYMMTKYSTDGTQDPRHGQQLRERLHAVGHLPHLRRELGRLLPPHRRHRQRRTAPRRSSQRFARYGVAGTGRELWATVTPDTSDNLYGRWNAEVARRRGRRRDDYRNGPTPIGWVVEIDPFTPASRCRRSAPRSAASRHEGACLGPVVGRQAAGLVHGRRLAQTSTSTSSSRRKAGTRPTPTAAIAAGDKYLDDGKLYVARFNADGTGNWLELTFGVTASPPATRRTPSPTRRTCWSTPASRPTPRARPRWTGRSGPRSTR